MRIFNSLLYTIIMRLLKNLFLIFLVIFLSSSLVRNIIDYQKKKDFFEKFKTQVEKEKKKQLTLKTEILKKTDAYQLEKTIRNKLNLAKPDETVVILPLPTPTPKLITLPPLPNWQQWWQVFFRQN